VREGREEGRKERDEEGNKKKKILVILETFQDHL